MFYEHWTDDNSSLRGIETTCLGDLFAHIEQHVNYYFDANTKAQPEIAPPHSCYSSNTSRATIEEVKAHVVLLKAAGFKLTHTLTQKGFAHTRGKAVEAHCFHITAGDMSPVMRRFALNGIRWIAENHGCRIAFAEICKTLDLSDTLAVFNAFLVASIADARYTAHNINLMTGYYRPLTEKEFKTWQNTMMNISMNEALRPYIIQDEPLREPGQDFTYLQKPNGYAIYHERLKAAQKWNNGAGKVDGLGILADIMGLNTLRGAVAV